MLRYCYTAAIRSLLAVDFHIRSVALLRLLMIYVGCTIALQSANLFIVLAITQNDSYLLKHANLVRSPVCSGEGSLCNSRWPACLCCISDEKGKHERPERCRHSQRAVPAAPALPGPRASLLHFPVQPLTAAACAAQSLQWRPP